MLIEPFLVKQAKISKVGTRPTPDFDETFPDERYI